MTASASDAALLLEVIAGEDGLDPRQVNIRTAPYTEALSKGMSGLEIGLVRRPCSGQPTVMKERQRD